MYICVLVHVSSCPIITTMAVYTYQQLCNVMVKYTNNRSLPEGYNQVKLCACPVFLLATVVVYTGNCLVPENHYYIWSGIPAAVQFIGSHCSCYVACLERTSYQQCAYSTYTFHGFCLCLSTSILTATALSWL